MTRNTMRFCQDVTDRGYEFSNALDLAEKFIDELPANARIIALTGDRHECLLVYELDEDTKRS